MAEVERHYSRSDLGDAILRALADSGKDIERLTPADLAPVDGFHTRGIEATRERLDEARGLVGPR